MRSTLLSFLLFIALPFITNAQTNWVTHKADERVSVKFPATPKEAIKGTMVATEPDSSIAYVLTVVDFTTFGVDSATLAPMKAAPEFAAQLKTGMAQSLPDVTMEDLKIGEWKGFTSYTTTATDTKKKKYNIMMVIIGSKLYSLSAVCKPNIDVAKADKFFASLTLVK